MLRAAALLTSSLAIVLAGVGCTQSFDAFEIGGETRDATSDDVTSSADSGAVDDAPLAVDAEKSDAGDGGPPDATEDASCAATCVANATTCALDCQAKDQTCEQACSNNGCRNQCRNTETSCRSKCEGACTTCGADAGCNAAAACAASTK